MSETAATADADGDTEAAGNEVPAGHTYDGIQEYDNPTPMWWNVLFLGTVVFAPVYMLWFHAPNTGRTIAARFEKALGDNIRLQFGELGELEPDGQTLLRFMNDTKWLPAGKSSFQTNCASCHGREGAGLTGPNLTDDFYLNVNEIVDIGKVIQNGAKGGAMPAWGNRMHPTELVLVAAYVASLRGKDLSSSRPAEGKEIAPWPAAIASPPATADEPEPEPAG